MRDRIAEKNTKPSKSIRFLYGTKFGGVILKLVSRRWVSKLVGGFLNTRLSRLHIKKFIKNNGIDMSDYENVKYKSFNAFFTRRIKPDCRPFDTDINALVSPCDAKLTAFPIDGDSVFEVKGFDYTLETLLKNKELAAEFAGGVCLIFRLAVTDYHRYAFFDGGTKEDGRFIKGRLYTVQPTALEKRRVFSENCRECTVLHTDNFGDAVQVEVGATMVGRIVNNKVEARFERGDEKGFFEFGGSTVILLLKKGAAVIDAEIMDNTIDGYETVVKCGERIGHKVL